MGDDLDRALLHLEFVAKQSAPKLVELLGSHSGLEATDSIDLMLRHIDHVSKNGIQETTFARANITYYAYELTL